MTNKNDSEFVAEAIDLINEMQQNVKEVKRLCISIAERSASFRAAMIENRNNENDCIFCKIKRSKNC